MCHYVAFAHHPKLQSICNDMDNYGPGSLFSHTITIYRIVRASPKLRWAHMRIQTTMSACNGNNILNHRRARKM